MRKVELVVKGRAWPYITNDGPFGGSITTYLQRWELNINDIVRKNYNRSDYMLGSPSNSKNTKLPAVRNRNNNPYRNKTPAMRWLGLLGLVYVKVRSTTYAYITIWKPTYVAMFILKKNLIYCSNDIIKFGYPNVNITMSIVYRRGVIRRVVTHDVSIIRVILIYRP